jgi:IS5 family transposase
MRPQKTEEVRQEDQFRSRLSNIINMRHALVKLSQSIDWEFLESKTLSFYAEKGRPGLAIRLIVGLHILKQMYNLSDEGVCDRWEHDPYFQYFTGESYFQHRFPIERSSMTYFRKRVGEEFFTGLLQESLHTAHKLGALETKQIKRVVTDTTVQEKAITFPTDAKLRYRAILGLANLSKEKGLLLRQSYVRVSKKAVVSSCRYRHAKQMKRAKKVEKKLLIYLGRIIRDIERKLEKTPLLKPCFKATLEKAHQIYTQKKTDTDKIYAWHAPEVECISKGKAHKPYEFGCKVSITTNVNAAPAGHFVLHAAALHGRPFDGHTLAPVLEQMQAQTGISFERAYVDKGYRGHRHPQKRRIFISGQKRGITPTIKRELKRRSVVEPLIGHLKNDGRLGRNYLQGMLGDKLNVLMVSAGYNFKLILRWLKFLWLWIFYLIQDIFRYNYSDIYLETS